MMKRLILAAFAAVCLLACQKNDGGGVVVRQSVDVTIKADGVMSGYVPYGTDDFKVTQDVMVSYYLYDPSGQLKQDGTFYLTSFSGGEVVTFADLSGTEGYTLVALAYCVDANNDVNVKPAYSVTGKESLSSLTVTQEDENAYGEAWSALGYAAAAISPSAGSVTVNLKPATALIYMEWRKIHAREGEPVYPLYGNYTATASDVWGENTYTWTITVEQGTSSNEVIITNLSPAFVERGYPYDPEAEYPHNIFKGTYDATAGTIVVPRSQSIGLAYTYQGEKYTIFLEGGREEGDTIYYEDLVLNVGNGTLTTANMYGTTCHTSEVGWWDLFDPGIVFVSDEQPQSGTGTVNNYGIIYHLNNVMRFNGTSPVFSTNLGEIDNEATWLSPAEYPNYDYIYDWTFLFPGDIRIFGRAVSDAGMDDTSVRSVSLAEGSQYVFTLDCEALTLSSRQGSYGGFKSFSPMGWKRKSPVIPSISSAIRRETGTDFISCE